jgi:shikimate kinase
MGSVVVLLGPPGSGKTSIGEALERKGFRWREWELVIRDRWGSREAFLDHKAEALPALHEEILRWVAAEGSPAAFETTGLSDAPLLDALERSSPSMLVVRLDVSEEQAARRVAARPDGRHLSDDVETNRAVWRSFQEHVVPHRRVDLIVDTEAQSIDSVVAMIVTAIGE